VSRPDSKGNGIPAVNLSPIFSAEASSRTVRSCSGLDALSTLYGERTAGEGLVSEPNEFSYWLGPKIAAAKNRELDGTYIEKPVNTDKENDAAVAVAVPARSESEPPSSVLSDILNRQSSGGGGGGLKSPDKISITVNKQSSVWLNASRDYAREPVDDKDMDELHTELDKILDQLQKLVT